MISRWCYVLFIERLKNFFKLESEENMFDFKWSSERPTINRCYYAYSLTIIDKTNINAGRSRRHTLTDRGARSVSLQNCKLSCNNAWSRNYYCIYSSMVILVFSENLMQNYLLNIWGDFLKGWCEVEISVNSSVDDWITPGWARVSICWMLSYNLLFIGTILILSRRRPILAMMVPLRSVLSF